MGISIVDKTADYSSVSLGFNGIYTSATDGLVAIHELRGSVPRIINNAASDKSDAKVIGAPVITNNRTTVTNGNTVDMGVKPIGQRTVAIVAKMRTSGVYNKGLILDNWNYGDTTNGGDVYRLYSHIFAAQGLAHTDATPSNTLDIDVIASIAVTDIVGDELFVVTMQDNVGLTIYHPRTDRKVFTATPNKFFSTKLPQSYRFVRTDFLSESQDVSLFALWNRPLTSEEIAKLYKDLQPQMDNIGISI